METRATPSGASRLMGVLPDTVGRGRRQSLPVVVLIVAFLALGCQSTSVDAAVCPAGCSCQHSGEQVSCVGLNTIPRFFGLSPKTLRITQHRITKISAKSFEGLKHLEKLEITGGRLSEISDDAFFALIHLRKINISHNELTVLPRNAFITCQQLQLLDLSWNPLVLPGRKPLLASKSLSALDISFCSLSRLPDEVFSAVPALTELRLRGNNLQLVSKCSLEPVKDLILVDDDPTIQWINCSSEDATTSDTPQMTRLDDSEGAHGSGKRPPGDHVLTYAHMAFVPTLAQWIFLIVAALFLALLLTCIRKACQPAEPRKEHKYEILGGSQTSRLPITLYQDLRTSRISTNSCDPLTDYTRVYLGDCESRQYVPNHFRPAPVL